MRLIYQFKDGESMTDIKDVLSLRMNDLEEAWKLLQSMAIDCAKLKGQHPPGSQPGQNQAAAQAAAAAGQESQSGQTTPLSAANL